MAGYFPTENVNDQLLWLKRQLLCVKDCCEGNTEAITIINNYITLIQEGMITYITDLTDAEILALSGIDIQTFYQSTDTSTMYYVNQAGDPTVFHPEDLDISYFERRATIDYISENITDVAGSYADFRDTDIVGIGRDYMNMPSMVQHNKTGKIYSFFRAGTNHSFFNDSYILMRVSHDGGETYTDLANTAGLGNYDVVLDGSGVGGYDAPGAIVTPSGRLILFIRYFDAGNTYIENQTWYSDDGGATWTQAPTPWAAPSLGYVYGNATVEIPNGGILISYRDIQTDRYIRVAESFDDGLTWAVRSTMLDNSDRGWNFGETILEDYGGGRIVAITRLSADNDDSENYPFICVSHDYGLTWAGDNETLGFDDIQNGRYGSGFLKLEGPGNSLGGPIANTSCLPYFQRADYLGRQYMVITYHLRELPNSSQLKLTVIDLDRWLTVGQDAIDPTIVDFIFAASPEGTPYDVEGNHGFIIGSKYNFDRIIGVTSVADGLSSNGPQQIHYFTYKGVKDMIEDYENYIPPGDNLGDHIMDQNLETNGFWISADGDNEGMFVDINGDVGFGQGIPTEAIHLAATKNILLDQGDIIVDIGNIITTDGRLGASFENTADANSYTNLINLTVNPSVNQVGKRNSSIETNLSLFGSNDIGEVFGTRNEITFISTGNVGNVYGTRNYILNSLGSVGADVFGSLEILDLIPVTPGSINDAYGFQSITNIGGNLTVNDVFGLEVEINNNTTSTGNNLYGLYINDIAPGSGAASFQNRYGIFIANTGNDAGIALEDFVIKSENTKDSQFAGLINYASDLSGSYTNRSLVDKEYVDNFVIATVPSIYNILGALTVNTTLADGGFNLNFTGTGARSHSSTTYVNTTTGASNNAVGTFGTTTAWKWGAGGFTDSINAGFNLVNEESGVTENELTFINSGLTSTFTVKTLRISDNYYNSLTVNTSYITLASDDGLNMATLVVDGKISPRIEGLITDGTDTANFFVKPLEALLEATTATLATQIGGELRLKTEFVASSNVALALGQVPVLKDVATGEVEYSIPAPWLIGAEQTGTFSAVNHTISPVDVSAGVSTVNPFAIPAAGDKFMISDSRGNANTFNITIDFVTATQNFHGASANYTIAVNGETATFRYIDSTIGWIKE